MMCHSVSLQYVKIYLCTSACTIFFEAKRKKLESALLFLIATVNVNVLYANFFSAVNVARALAHTKIDLLRLSLRSRFIPVAILNRSIRKFCK